MRSHRPRLLSLVALAFAGVLGNAGCTYYTVYSQPRGTIRGGSLGVSTSTGNCCGCATPVVTPVCGQLASGLIGHETYENQRLEVVQYIHGYVQPVESYPVDPQGRMDTTMAFVGTRSMFERAGFEVVGTTDAVASKMPRIVMRRTLT